MKTGGNVQKPTKEQDCVVKRGTKLTTRTKKKTAEPEKKDIATSYPIRSYPIHEKSAAEMVYEILGDTFALSPPSMTFSELQSSDARSSVESEGDDDLFPSSKDESIDGGSAIVQEPATISDDDDNMELEYPSLIARSVEKEGDILPQKGQIFWSKYRNYEVWPVMITNYQKKAKKVTFIYLPVQLPLNLKKCTTFKQKAVNLQPFLPFIHTYQKDGTNLELNRAVEQGRLFHAEKDRLLSSFGVDCVEGTETSTSDYNSSDVVCVGATDAAENSGVTLPKRTKEQEEQDALLKLIKSEDCQKYLQSLLSGGALCSSARWQRWLTACQLRLSGRTFKPALEQFGPITDRMQELIELVSSVRERTPSLSSALTSTLDSDEPRAAIHCADFDFIVLAPEATKWAIMKHFDKTEEMAEQWLANFNAGDRW